MLLRKNNVCEVHVHVHVRVHCQKQVLWTYMYNIHVCSNISIRFLEHTHTSVHCDFRDMMSNLYMCWYSIKYSLTREHSDSNHTIYYNTPTILFIDATFPNFK